MINRTKVVLIALIVFVALVLFVSLVYLRLSLRGNQSNPNQQPSNIIPTKSPLGQINPIKRTVIGETTDQEIKTAYQAATISTNERGGTEYALNSIWGSRSHLIETTNGIASFERALAPLNPNEPGFSKISTTTKELGEPEEIIPGSLYYGTFASTYIYSSKGITLVGNPNTDEIYEFQYYIPMPIEKYKDLYGQDIDTNPREHKFDPSN